MIGGRRRGDRASVFAILAAIALSTACLLATKPVAVIPQTIPSVPYLDHQVLLMEELYADTEVCFVEHAYTHKVIRRCASLLAVRDFILGHEIADDNNH